MGDGDVGFWMKGFFRSSESLHRPSVHDDDCSQGNKSAASPRQVPVVGCTWGRAISE